MKCATCFRNDECMLFSSNHEGIKHCLGPFKNQKERLETIKENFLQDNKISHERLSKMRGYFKDG